MNDDWKYQCARCGEIVSNYPCPKSWAFSWVHRNPMECIRATEERVRKETEARVRAELATASQ